MAWIKTYQSLERHHKTFKLMSILNCSNNEAIGILVKLWWWCLDYADDGDLTNLQDELRIYLGHSKVFEALIQSGFIDENTFLIHDWTDYAYEFLRTKYHTSNPKKLKYIVRKHKDTFRTPLGQKKDAQIKTDLDRLRHTDKDINTCAIIEHFNNVCKKKLTLTPERERVIKNCLKAGRSVEHIKQAITNFSKDDWEDRHKYCDLIYAIGKQRGKPDAFDKWFNLTVCNPISKSDQARQQAEELKRTNPEKARAMGVS